MAALIGPARPCKIAGQDTFNMSRNLMPPNTGSMAAFSDLARSGGPGRRNFVNEGELMAWLAALGAEKLGRGDVRSQKALGWLSTVARKWLIREGAASSADAAELAEQGLAPMWAIKAAGQGQALARLDLSRAERIALGGILDWMRSDKGPSLASDLSRISVPQAMRAEERWIQEMGKRAANKQRGLAEQNGTSALAEIEGPDWGGWLWVCVSSPEALDREGALMRHCVGSYAEDVESGSVQIYSLRDPSGHPKLTVEARQNVLAQLRAASNAACPPQLKGALPSFISAFAKLCARNDWGSPEPSDELEASGVTAIPGLGLTIAGQELSESQAFIFKGWLKKAGHAKGRAALAMRFPLLAKGGLAAQLAEALPMVDACADKNALSLAAEHGHEECVELLAPFADIGQARQALERAALHGSARCVQALLARVESDPRAVGEAIKRAAQAGNVPALELLLSAGEPEPLAASLSLELAAERGHAQCLKLLLPASDPCHGGAAALCAAARKGSVECVRILACAESVEASGFVALRSAASRRRSESVKCVELLLPFHVKEEAEATLRDCGADPESFTWPQSHAPLPEMARKLARMRRKEACELADRKLLSIFLN